MTVDDSLALVASMKLEDGRRWGDVAAPFQWEDAQRILLPGPDDARLSWLSRPKGASKSTDLAALSLAWLLTQARDLDEGYVVASDQDQARRLLDRARGLIARTSGLGRRLEAQTNQIVNTVTGAKLVALAADAAGAEGLLSPWLALDEVPQWAETRSAKAMWDACYSSIVKMRGLRYTVIGHAGVSGSYWHRLYERAVESPAWRVHDVPGPLEWIDRGLLADQEATLAPSQYARRHLNIWSSSEDQLTSIEDLRACVTLDGPLTPVSGIKYCVGVDLGIRDDATVAIVAHLEDMGGGDPGRHLRSAPGEREQYLQALVDRGALGRQEMLERLGGRVAGLEARPVRVVVDRVQAWRGSRAEPVSLSEVEEWVAQASWSFGKAVTVFDPWQAIGMAQRLAGRGLPVEEYAFGSASVGRLAATLHQLLRDRALALPDDEALLSELASVRLVERTPGVMRLDHDSGRHDDHAVALALCAQRLLSEPASRPAQVTWYRNMALQGTR